MHDDRLVVPENTVGIWGHFYGITVPVLVTWRQLANPRGDPVNHLFVAGIPVLGGFLAPFLLREWDRGVLEGRGSHAAVTPAA